MDNTQKASAIIIICLLIASTTLLWTVDFIQAPSNQATINQDMNVLKANDVALANLIVQEQTTVKYLNDNCKVTSDSNEVTVLTCLKVVPATNK